MAYLKIEIEVDPCHLSDRWGSGGMDKYEFELIADQHYGILFGEWAENEGDSQREHYYNEWIDTLHFDSKHGRIPNFDAFMKHVAKEIDEVSDE